MKMLYSDKVIAVMRKIPTALWFILLAASSFFLQCHDTIETTASTVKAAQSYYEQAGTNIAINVSGTTAVICILEALLSAGLIELFFYVGYNLFARRFYCAVNKQDFSFRLRILAIISNIIVGIFNIPAFFWKDSHILTACVDFIIPMLLVAWYYEDFRKKYVPKRNQSNLFKFASQICLGAAFVLRIVVALEYTLVQDPSTTAIDIAVVWVDVGMVVLVAALAYINYKRLDKIAKEPEDNDLFIPKEPEDDTIFKDFGF